MRAQPPPPPLALWYISHPVRTHILQPHRAAMEHRPNSHPEHTGRYMTGVAAEPSIVKPRCVPDVLVDIGPDTSVQHLIRKRAQQLKEDREGLKASLERYIQQRTIQKWTPPVHPSYNLFEARLQSFDAWTSGEGVPSPEALAEAGFFYQGTINSCFSNTLSLISHTHSHAFYYYYRSQRSYCVLSLRNQTARLGSKRRSIRWTCKMVAILCLPKVYQGDNLHC
jgi:hypothetical protein